MCVMRNTNNLMEADMMEKIKLYDILIDSFCKKYWKSYQWGRHLQKELNAKFPEVSREAWEDVI